MQKLLIWFFLPMVTVSRTRPSRALSQVQCVVFAEGRMQLLGAALQAGRRDLGGALRVHEPWAIRIQPRAQVAPPAQGHLANPQSACAATRFQQNHDHGQRQRPGRSARWPIFSFGRYASSHSATRRAASKSARGYGVRVGCSMPGWWNDQPVSIVRLRGLSARYLTIGTQEGQAMSSPAYLSVAWVCRLTARLLP